MNKQDNKPINLEINVKKENGINNESSDFEYKRNLLIKNQSPGGNVEKDIKEILLPVANSCYFASMRIEINIDIFYIKEKIDDEKRSSRNSLKNFLLIWSTSPVLKTPLYSQLEVNYNIFYDQQVFAYSFKSKEKIFYYSLGFDLIKSMIVYAILKNGIKLTTSQSMLALFPLIIASAYIFSDGPFADRKAYEDALNQFKEDFKLNLEKTAQACKGEGK
ncbi:MAG: hypothetical protein KBA66_12125 [Leptospiraceae bacterium]|nr:hypothetical protein [Leptospiraceae bacterium]